VDASTASLITSTALSQGVDPNLALAVANAESGGNQYTSSGNLVTSSTGAVGIFQLEPGTAAGLGVDPTDPAQNVQGGVTYLSQMINQFGDVPTALAAYNWGPGNVATKGAAAAPASTQSYVGSVLNAIGFGSGSPSPLSPPSADGGSTLADLFPGGLADAISDGFPSDGSSLPPWVPAVAVTAGAAVLAYLVA
jgi:hypothetical protein